ncbi:amidohydrolase family protein [Butyrivibrio sp. MC2021]|uniref:amidohydrolase family protein n=1 Tax=Butyrivibrio sp. MC2021 TaxID=1408306 RepID=UPI00047B7CF7|nr:amidohydrolase family protein [Butyrivibrio sp. MC2021]
MIIDIHTHTFPEKIAAKAIESLSKEAHIVANTDGTNAGLKTSMKEASVNISVIMPVATSAEQVVKINDRAVKVNEEEESLISFGCIHPEFEDYRNELRRIADLGIKGIKIHPVYQKLDIDDVKFLDIIDCAAENGLIVLTHAGLDVGFPGVVKCSPKMCRHVWDEIGSFKFVLAHMGGWENWEEVPEYFAGTEVYLDTSFSTEKIKPLNDGYWDGKNLSMMGEDRVMKIINSIGADRILFGSDNPWTSQKDSIDFIKRLPLKQEELEGILGGNAYNLICSNKS